MEYPDQLKSSRPRPRDVSLLAYPRALRAHTMKLHLLQFFFKITGWTENKPKL